MVQDELTPLKALIVEDSENDALLLARHLKSGGYEVIWERVDTEADMLAALRQQWDIVFSDHSMPDFSGTRALEVVRRVVPDVPFIFVSGTIGETAAVEAIKSGAHDYVMKGQLARLLPTVDRELRDVRLNRERREADKERARLSKILEVTPDLVAIFDSSGCLSYVNLAGRQLLDLDLEVDIEGRHLHDIFPDSIATHFSDSVFPAIFRDGVWIGETAIPIAEGIEMPVSLVVMAHYNSAADIDYISAIARNISERKSYEAELQHRTTHDSLTGLPNRFLLVDRFESAIQHAQRQRSSIAVLILDLDNFKRVNDNLGHAAGDELLRQAASRLKCCMGPTDTIARHGGDEFTIVIYDFKHTENIIVLLRKLRASFENPLIVRSHEVFVTFSAGIALYPHDGKSAEDLLRHADAAMYRAKKMGSNQSLYYSPNMNARGQESLALEADLQRAVENNEFLLYCQPQMNISTGHVVGAEGLVRWQHPVRGLMSPADFIPLLESSGLIIQVGEWVLRKACHLYAVLHSKGIDLRISVNVSVAQFSDTDFLGKIHRILKDENMPPDRLELEITENIFMRDPLSAAEILIALRELGVRTAIDDFGTGYSSMAYLKRFPLDVLKIDQTFVADLGVNSGDNAIVEASILLAQRLGLEVVAEGVETLEQIEYLRAFDCNLIQGFYVSHPLSDSELMAFLSSNQCPVRST